jgi:hypothetical protein
MLRLAIATLIASAVVATALPKSSYALERTDPVKKHRRNHPEAKQYVAAPGAYYGTPGPGPYYGTPGPAPYYGTPGSYYPAPPFPFFLLPGPWWLPAHP